MTIRFTENTRGELTQNQIDRTYKALGVDPKTIEPKGPDWYLAIENNGIDLEQLTPDLVLVRVTVLASMTPEEARKLLDDVPLEEEV